MCVLYLGMALCVLFVRSDIAVEVFGRIFREAFTGTAAAGGAMGIGFQQAMMIGVRRAAFSNEAGLGTAPLAHGAAKTNEPVREGLVAMLGPFIDTIVVCSLTAFVILSSGLETVGEISGVSLTADSVESALGAPGRALLVLIVMMFAISTMVSYSYYGKRCFAYLFGAKRDGLYTWFYLLGIFVGAWWSASMVINLIDTALAPDGGAEPDCHAAPGAEGEGGCGGLLRPAAGGALGLAARRFPATSESSARSANPRSPRPGSRVLPPASTPWRVSWRRPSAGSARLTTGPHGAPARRRGR